MHAIRFAGKVIAIIVVVVAALWAIGALFRLSIWSGSLAVTIVAVALYLTADRWLRWLPGLLIFGVLNSVIALLTGHAPNSPANVSSGLSLLMVAFFSLGTFLSNQVQRVTHFERIAWLLYLCAMVMPAVVQRGTEGVVTARIALPLLGGAAAILVAWARQQMQSATTSQDRC